MRDHPSGVDDRCEKTCSNVDCYRFRKRSITPSDRLTCSVDQERVGQAYVRDRAGERIDTGRSVNHSAQRYCAIVPLLQQFVIVPIVFMIVPIVELFTIIEMCGHIGFRDTLWVMFAVAFLGSWLVKQDSVHGDLL